MGNVATLVGALGLACATGACGRIAFDVAPDAAVAASCVGKPFGAPQPVANLHSGSFDDWGGSLNAAGTELYFHSYRPASLAGSNIFVARGNAPDGFAAPTVITELSSARDEFQPAVTGDALDLVFSSDQGDPYLLELWESRRTTTASAWSTPVRIAELGTDTMHELDPWLTPDGLGLYYAIGPSLTAATLWHASRATRSSPWNAPAQVPGLAGAGGFSVSPTLSADELEIFFATDLATAGDLDIVTATRTDRSAPFGPVQRITSLSTAGDDAALHLSFDGRYLYLVQDSDYAAGGNSTIAFAERSCD